ncbi:hypothetical protein Tco_0855914 [Tanacetum coccineum]
MPGALHSPKGMQAGMEALTGAFTGSEIDSLNGQQGQPGGEECSMNPGSLVAYTLRWLGNLPSYILGILRSGAFDRRELDKQEVEQPEVDRFDLDEPGVVGGWTCLVGYGKHHRTVTKLSSTAFTGRSGGD